jgi:hypothetical protein
MKTFYEEFGKEPQENLDDAFIWACLKGEFEKIKYLLTSPELKIHANIHTEGDNGLMVAFKKSHLNIIKYLLTSPELKEHANIYNNQSAPFITSCIYSNNEVLEYLILDYKVDENEYITNFLNKNAKKIVKNLFETRELTLELTHSSSNEKKIKPNKL